VKGISEITNGTSSSFFALHCARKDSCLFLKPFFTFIFSREENHQVYCDFDDRAIAEGKESPERKFSYYKD
jgi:hypothetical protein